MRAYLKFIDVWAIVKSGWKCLDKPMVDQTKDEKSDCIKNDKAMNYVFMSLPSYITSHVNKMNE